MKRGGGTRKKGVAVALVTVAIVGLMAILPGLVAADPVNGTFHRGNPPVWFPHRSDGEWLFLLDSSDNCLSTISMDSGVDFFVLQGYNAYADNANPIKQYKDLMDPTTEFKLYVDGTPVRSAMHVWVQALPTDTGSWWFVLKFYLTSFNGGMTGTHVFTGVWYYLGTVELTCPVVVTFT